nr:DUF4136 domain-containing protein [uncultured Sphingomonas sp.]
MKFNKVMAAIALGVSALGLSACATGFPTKVSRYQAMPAPQGQSFVVVPMDARNVGGLEFSRYAELVSQQMQAQGYAQAPSINQATMVVQVGYDVDNGRTEVVSDPFYSARWRDPFGWSSSSYWGRPYYYSRYGYYGPRSGFYFGWDDPFWGSPWDSGIRSYTSYTSELDMTIRRKADNASLFEGKARARSTTDNLGVLVPNLVQAMFTGFPGQSGETIKITVPPPQKAPKG